MTFKLSPLSEMLDYMRNRAEKMESNNVRVKKNLKYFFLQVEQKRIKPIFAFHNEFGEPYVCVIDSKWKTHWAGSESSWDFARSFYEDTYVKKVFSEFEEAEKVKISKDTFV